MKVYWSRCGPRHGNFGDKITPLLLKKSGVRCDWAPPERAEFFGAGSVLEKVPEKFRGTIWTTGFIEENSRRSLSHAKVVAVRGQLTLQRISGIDSGRVVLGDAGLLCDLLQPPAPKRFALGIVPHFTEQDDPVLEHLRQKDGQISIIDICAEPARVLTSISECEHIVSTSLHGLIIADSYGIANGWVHLSRRGTTVIGNGFKFRDYYSAFGVDAPAPELITHDDTAARIISRLRMPERASITERKEPLRDTLNTIASSPLARETAQQEKERATWSAGLESARETLVKILPRDATLVLADEDQLRHTLPFERVFAFKDRDGFYWGAPSSDAEAIEELERLAQLGARYFAITFPSFWMLDAFPDFSAFLSSRGRCEFRDAHLALFCVEGPRG
jgi:pyruvyltransferase